MVFHLPRGLRARLLPIDSLTCRALQAAILRRKTTKKSIFITVDINLDDLSVRPVDTVVILRLSYGVRVSIVCR